MNFFQTQALTKSAFIDNRVFVLTVVRITMLYATGRMGGKERRLILTDGVELPFTTGTFPADVASRVRPGKL